MYATVGCAECGKAFQVERGAMGQPATCPWCQARVPALPVARSAEPLPLPEEVRDAPPKPIRRRRLGRWVVPTLFCAFLAVASFAVQRYRGGAVPPFVMRTFEAPDGSCRATLPGSAAAVAEPGTPFTPMQTGFAAYASESWFTRARGGLGWIEVDPERAKLVRTEDLLANVRDGLGRWLGEPTVEKEALVKSGSADGSEVRFGTGGTRYAARIVAILDAPRPRVYFVWVGGAQFEPDGEVSARVLASFRLKASGK